MRAWYWVGLILAIVAGAWAVFSKAWWGVVIALSVICIALGLLHVLK